MSLNLVGLLKFFSTPILASYCSSFSVSVSLKLGRNQILLSDRDSISGASPLGLANCITHIMSSRKSQTAGFDMLCEGVSPQGIGGM